MSAYGSIFSLVALIRLLPGDAGPNAAAPQLAWLSVAPLGIGLPLLFAGCLLLVSLVLLGLTAWRSSSVPHWLERRRRPGRRRPSGDAYPIVKAGGSGGDEDAHPERPLLAVAAR
jgi:hypothetical protein